MRADGDSSIGLGHIMRLRSLAIYLNNLAEIIFVTKCNNLPVIDSLLAENIIVISLESDISIQKEIDLIINLNPDCVILDGYEFVTYYQNVLKKNKLKIISIDDDFNSHYESDIVINHAPGVNPGKYSKEEYTKLLLGLDYLIINPIFLNCDLKNKIPLSISVNFGGADSGNLTLKYLKYLIESDVFKKINVITGSANVHSDSIKEYIINLNSETEINHFHSISQTELAELFCKSEFVLCPSSSVAYESLTSKCIVISGISADNQINIYKGLSDLNLIIKCGDFNSIPENEFKSIVKNSILNSEFKNQILDNILSKFTVNPVQNYRKLISEFLGIN